MYIYIPYVFAGSFMCRANGRATTTTFGYPCPRQELVALILFPTAQLGFWAILKENRYQLLVLDDNTLERRENELCIAIVSSDSHRRILDGFQQDLARWIRMESLFGQGFEQKSYTNQ